MTLKKKLAKRVSYMFMLMMCMLIWFYTIIVPKEMISLAKFLIRGRKMGCKKKGGGGKKK